MDKPIATATLTDRGSAAAESVYDLLADIHSHLVWAGERQRPDYRLTSLEGPGGTARVGSVFTSTGRIPMSNAHWEDRSTVTAADRPTHFEFVTEGTVKGRRTLTSLWLNRYEISRLPSGSAVTYRLSLLEVDNPFLRIRPPMRAFTFRFGIPMFSGPGLRNLLRLAEEREERSAVGIARTGEPAR